MWVAMLISFPMLRHDPVRVLFKLAFFLCNRLLGQKYQIILPSLFWVFKSSSTPDILVTLISLFIGCPFKEGISEINFKLYFLTTEENVS